jgi:hypothetical protein
MRATRPEFAFGLSISSSLKFGGGKIIILLKSMLAVLTQVALLLMGGVSSSSYSSGNPNVFPSRSCCT